MTRVVVCGPTRARCGVAVTTACWAQGFAQAGADVRLVTNDADLTHASLRHRLVEPEPTLAGIRTFAAYGRPDMAYPARNPLYADRYWRQMPSDLDLAALDEVLAGCGSGDVLFLEQSEACILPSSANKLLSIALGRGLQTVVRLHSQLLQGLDSDFAGLFVAPMPLEECLALPDCELTHNDTGRWLVAPHPVPSAPSAPGQGPSCQAPPAHSISSAATAQAVAVAGYGQRHRMPHEFVREELEQARISYRAVGADPVSPWRPLEAVVVDLAQSSTIVMLYPPTPGTGRSSALSVALAAGRPLVVSDATFLRDARGWGGLCDEATVTEVVRKAQDRGGEPWPQQAEYALQWSAPRAAKAVLDRALG